jgi:regulation of enolase protein 1 (concanavalin A-like superfamily)
MPARIVSLSLLPLLVVLLTGGSSAVRSEDTAKVLFEETFAGELDKGWSWVRESPKDWKIDKDKKELLIHAMPGVSLYNSRTLTNILLREPPAAKKETALAFEVHVHHRPLNGFETSGLIWYFDDDNAVHFVKELIDGKIQLVLGRKKGGKSEANIKLVPYDKDDVDMRLVVSGTKAEAQYRASAADKWQTVEQSEMPSDGKARIGLRAGHGSKDKPSWARFSGFRIVALSPAETREAKPLFEDRFNSKLAGEWTWVREDPKSWRIDRDGLQIRVLPGLGKERKNILLRPAHQAKDERAVEVFLDNQPSLQFEHAGLLCFFDEQHRVGLIKESLGKQEIVLAHNKAGKPTYTTAPYEGRTVWLRMVLSGGKATGFYRATEKDEWKKVGTCDLPSEIDCRFGVVAGAGPKDAERWARFRDFRVLPAIK